MRARRRDGSLVEVYDGQGAAIRFFYENPVGQQLLRVLIRPRVSQAVGRILDAPISKGLIAPFIRKNKIPMEDYPPRQYQSFNDFFTRSIIPGRRAVPMEPEVLISPCDGKLTAIPITPDARFWIKGTEYTLESLLRDSELAQRYQEGVLLLFRLAVDDYHHYCVVADGILGENHVLPGVYHTVNPLAAEKRPIYRENTREYALLETTAFGRVLTMEVGALLVGKITNTLTPGKVSRGQEKGYFEFGGSTVILLMEPERVCLDADIAGNSENGEETLVRMGEKIGYAQSNRKSL